MVFVPKFRDPRTTEGHRENPQISPPQEVFTAERLDQLRKRVPNPSAMQVHI